MTSGKRDSFDIFISYRRNDTAWAAGRIHDFLKTHFDEGRIFRDTERIALGQRFPNVIESALHNCKVMLVIIGEKWLTSAYEDGRRRLDNPDDWVRIEIKTALERSILVIPIIVDAAKLPTKEALPEDLQSLVDLQGIVGLTDTYFLGQMYNLVDTLKDIVELAIDKPYPHLDVLQDIVRENIIEGDDKELLDYMKERLKDEIIEEWGRDSYFENYDFRDDR